MKSLSLAALVVALTPLTAMSEPPAMNDMSGTPAPAAGVGELVRSVYDIVSFPAGTTPDWDALRATMLEDALIVQPLPGGKNVHTLTVDAFVQLFIDDIEEHKLSERGFHETVHSVDVSTFGNIAHAYVVFEVKVGDTPGPGNRGLDSFQLVRKDGIWKIASIATQFERPGRPLTKRFLEPATR
ncbi:MAG: nuclear transport factor 2 family protein [Planctomycetota bacterium]|jgi:hypothetical protein